MSKTLLAMSANEGAEVTASLVIPLQRTESVEIRERSEGRTRVE